MGGAADNETPKQSPPGTAAVGYNLIENNTFESNGSGGIQGLGHHDNVISNNLFRENNTLRHKSHEMGCIKFHISYDNLIVNNKFVNNKCMGVWLDNSVKRTRISRNFIYGSSGPSVSGDGIFLEMTEEGAGNENIIDNNVIIGVERYGIYTHDASYSTIAHNLIMDSGKAGIHLRDLLSTRKGNCHDHQIFNNLIFNNQSPVQIPLDWSDTTFSNGLDHNVYWPPTERFAVTTYSKAEDPKVAIMAAIYNKWQAAGSIAPELSGNEWETPGSNNGYWTAFNQWQAIQRDDLNSIQATVNNLQFNPATYTLSVDLDNSPTDVGCSQIPGVTRDYSDAAIGSNPKAGSFQNIVSGANTFDLWPDYQSFTNHNGGGNLDK
jgi:parallel beta-helix repeat protein